MIDMPGYHNRLTGDTWRHMAITESSSWHQINAMEEWCTQCVGERHFHWQVQVGSGLKLWLRCVWWFKDLHTAQMFELAWHQS